MTRSLKSRQHSIIARSARLIALFGALLIAPACAQQTDQPSRVAPSELEQKLAAAFEKLELRGFNGVVAVAAEGQAPIIKGFGDDATRSGAPDAATLVDTGSITKTITAVAALALIDDGRLATSDRLSAYFPDAPPDKAGITVHQLLTHSSGLPAAVASDDEAVSRDIFLQRALAADLLFQPGASYSYSNVGYSLVAAIIEKISDQSYEEFIREQFFSPNNIASIGYARTFVPDRSLLTQDGETIAAASWAGDDAYWALIGNGGLTTTAGDMIKLRRLFKAGALVSNAAVNLAQTPMVREGEGAPSHYGYGMVVEDHPSFGRIYWHNGGNEHFLANWTDYADHNVIVFTASNTPDFNADLAGLTLAEALFDVQIFPGDYDEKRAAE